MTKFNHAFTISFCVNSAQADGQDVTPAMLREALVKRIEDLDREEQWLEAAGAAFDSFEEESPLVSTSKCATIKTGRRAASG